MFQPNVAYITNIKIAQNILPILNAPSPQNRHFDQSSSFGMISGCLRNDIGMFFDEKEGRETSLQVYPRDR